LDIEKSKNKVKREVKREVKSKVKRNKNRVRYKTRTKAIKRVSRRPESETGPSELVVFHLDLNVLSASASELMKKEKRKVTISSSAEEDRSHCKHTRSTQARRLLSPLNRRNITLSYDEQSDRTLRQW